MVDLPTPPVPADADLTHFDDMPLEVRRLRDSGIAGEPNAEIFRCAVLLWCVAWHQVPAGSLPVDDAELCRLVGLGRDMKTWRKIRAGALRSWRPFSDGRLYHPVVTEKVIDRFNGSRLVMWNRECDRIRKENKARGERQGDLLTFPPKPAPIPYVWPPDGRKNSGGNGGGVPPEGENFPPENGLKGREEKRREEKKNPPLAAASVGDTPRAESAARPQAAAANGGPRAAMDAKALVDEAFRRWTVLAFDLKIPDVGHLNRDRRLALGERLAEIGGLEGWDVFLEKIRAAQFLRSEDDRPKFWVGLGKLLEPETFSKILEDRYAERHARERDSGEVSTSAALAAIRENLSR